MLLRQLLRKPFSPSHSAQSTNHTLRRRAHPTRNIAPHASHPPRRLNSNSTSSSSPSSSSSDKSRARIDRILARLPRFLHPYTAGLRNAPISHIISFLILHEITAIVPLVGLAGVFHYMVGVPGWIGEGKWIEREGFREGMERFGMYFGRKGWFGFERVGDGEGIKSRNADWANAGVQKKGGEERVGEREQEIIQETEKKWRVGEKGGRILVEVATAYAITKVLLPARILVSVWGTPWFARVVVGRVGKIFGKGKGSAGLGSKSVAAVNGATSDRIMTKGGEGMKKMP